MFNTQLFAYAAQEHSTKYGSTLEQCAKIAYKNHKHSVHNPYACLRKEIPLEYISESKTICKPITLAMSAPTADGSAAAVVCSRAFMESRGMQVSFRTGREIFNTLGTRVFSPVRRSVAAEMFRADTSSAEGRNPWKPRMNSLSLAPRVDL